jgi:BirA family biotin operon repressor/biotin-[acetyl-CoA-carboxylase] ligase
MQRLAKLLHHPQEGCLLGRTRIHLSCIDSTNTWLLNRPHLLQIEGLAVYADEQTSGKGSKGRTWLSLPGRQLFCSIGLKPRLTSNRLPGLTLFLGAGVTLGLQRLGVSGIGLKWPNDLLLNDKKIGGLLCETRQIEESRHVVAGIGLNLQGRPTGEIAETATSLEEAGYVISLEEALNAVLGGLNEIYTHIQKGNTSNVLQLWRRHSHTLGKQVRVVAAGTADITGTAIDVSENGALLLKTKDGIAQVSYGSLFYLS